MVTVRVRAIPVLASAAAALVVPASATAHVTAVPPFAAAGAETRLVLEVPNERRAEPMTTLRVRVPPGMEIRSAEPSAGFSAAVSGRDVTWSGGRLAPRATARFAFVALARLQPGAVALAAEQRYPDGRRVPWRVELTITPASRAATDDGRGLAPLLGAAAALVVVMISALSVRALRRRSLQNR